jgi:predicted RNA binding protein YcfA (HicA-like mRNA interferase family)
VSGLTVISAMKMSKILLRLGFQCIRQRGSHEFFRHPDGRATVVPMHKGRDLPRGTIRNILKDISITPEEYEQIRREI